MKRAVSLIAVLGWTLGCGVNEVTVEIRGGDGRLVRLDANDLVYRHNRLVQAGTQTFSELKRGSYSLAIVAGGYVDSRSSRRRWRA